MVTSSPGRIGLHPINGSLGVGIRIGQWLNASGFEDFEHAFMDLGDGTLIEAEPGGARIRPITEYKDASIYWCDNIYKAIPGYMRHQIAAEARKYEHVPYSFLDYDALVLHRLGLDTRRLQRYIGSTGHMICSQLVDRASTDGGHQMFPDRWDGFVTPGDIYLLDRRSA